MKNNARQSTRGVTLTEIMLAIFILALSFLPIIGVMGSSVKATTKEDSLNRAMNLCQEKLNTSLQFPFHHFDLNLGVEITNQVATPGLTLNLGDEIIEGVKFTSALTVTDRPGSFTIPVRDLSTGNPDDPTTWTFAESTIDYSNLVHSHKLKVSWTNKGETTSRFYTLVTFRAKLSED